MFMSHEHTSSKKTFQKPNILRRKPKITTVRTSNLKPLGAQSELVTSAATSEYKVLDSYPTETTGVSIRRPPQRLKININVEKDEPNNTFQEIKTVSFVQGNNFVDDSEHGTSQNPVNVEAFLNSAQPSECKAQNDSSDTQIEDHCQQKWHIDFVNDSDKLLIEPYDGAQVFLDEKVSVLPVTLTTSQQVPADFGSVEVIQDVSIEHFITRNVKFKCDAPDCGKQFATEQKLKRHKNIHNKNNKTPRLTIVECPVKKFDEQGVEQSCGRIFLVREELVKHLHEDHTLEEAPHRCTECGRRFFWAVGLRAHARAHCGRSARAPLACGWPGCGRAFRQPCRLREHARAHTGDKPYPCRHPNCGWSFRTASKLMRHARRHTGERRHACACGRAFLRREHLREHQARHAPAARAPRACPHDGCTQSFSNMSSLYLHMKKVHKKEEEKTGPKTELAEASTIALTDVENNMFMVSFVPEGGQESGAGGASPEPALWHAARTHCTWPLAPRAPTAPAAPPAPPAPPAPDAPTAPACALEHAHVEQSESSESNIYTVRSDLFLHGNVLHNEDSQQMGDGSGQHTDMSELVLSASSPPASPPHAGLGLLDTHSTIDLMQEELMYTDAAVDESSFQVLLLSGEELG